MILLFETQQFQNAFTTSNTPICHQRFSRKTLQIEINTSGDGLEVKVKLRRYIKGRLFTPVVRKRRQRPTHGNLFERKTQMMRGSLY